MPNPFDLAEAELTAQQPFGAQVEPIFDRIAARRKAVAEANPWDTAQAELSAQPPPPKATTDKLGGLGYALQRGVMTAQAIPDVIQAAGSANLGKPTIGQERRAFVSAMEDPRYEAERAAAVTPERAARVEATLGPKARLGAMMGPAETLQAANVDAVVQSQQAIEATPKSPAQVRMAQARTSGEKWAVWMQDPVELTASIALESLPPSIAGATVGSVVGGPAGMVAGVGGSSALMTFANEFLTNAGVDLTDPVAFQNFLNDPVAFNAAFGPAAVKAGIVGGADALTAGHAGRWIEPALKQGFRQKLLASAQEVGMQMAGGAGGEFAGQVATGQELDPFDIAMEALAEVATAPGEVAGNLWKKKQSPGRNPAVTPDDSITGNNPPAGAAATAAPPESSADLTARALADLPDEARAELQKRMAAEETPNTKAQTPTPDAAPATREDLKNLADFIQNGGNNPFAPKPAAQLPTEPKETGTPVAGEITPVVGTVPPAPAPAQSPSQPPTPQNLPPPVTGSTPKPQTAQTAAVTGGGLQTPNTKHQTPTPAVSPRKRFVIHPRSDGIVDVLDAIQKFGGLRSPGPEDSGDGDYDGFKEVMVGTAALLRRRNGGSHPTDMIQELQAEFPRIQSSQDLYDAIRNANSQRENLRRNGGGPEAQQDRFWTAATSPNSTSGLTKINVDQLQVGHVFRQRAPGVSHEELTVTRIDPDTNEVTVKDGTSFGHQDLPAGAEIWVQKKGLAPELRAGDVKPADAPSPVNQSPAKPGSPQPGGKPAVGRAVPDPLSDPGAVRAGERLERAFRAKYGLPNAKITLARGPARNASGPAPGVSLARTLQSLADVFGKRVVWFTTTDVPPEYALRGWAAPDGRYILVNAAYPTTTLGTVAHELLHQFKNSNPLLYADFKAAMLKLAKLPGSKYEKMKLRAKYAPGELGEELLSDFAAHAFNDPQFLKDFAAVDPGVFRRVVNRLLRLIDKALAKFTATHQAAADVFTELQTARDMLAKALHEWADYEGNVRKVEQEIAEANKTPNRVKPDGHAVNTKAQTPTSFVAGNATITKPGLVDLSGESSPFSVTAHHGTPHKVDRFTTAKIGTGEGAQVYGWGLYFAQEEKVAADYASKLGSRGEYRVDGQPMQANPADPMREALSLVAAYGWPTAKDEITKRISRVYAMIEAGREVADTLRYVGDVNRAVDQLQGKRVESPVGNKYTVTLNVEPEDLLDWDKPLSEQSEKVRAALQDFAEDLRGQVDAQESSEFGGMSAGDYARRINPEGAQIYNLIAQTQFAAGIASEITPKAASEYLASVGIRGIRYLDQGSRPQPRARHHLTIIPPWDATTEAEAIAFARKQFPTAKALFATARPDGAWDVSDVAGYEPVKQTFNYVIFSDDDITITHENGQPVTMAEAFSVDAGEDLFGAPESIADQKAREAREKAQSLKSKAQSQMIERAGARLTGKDLDTNQDAFANDATTRLDKSGQGSFFSVDHEFPEDFPDALLMTSGAAMKAHPDYKAAKAGDFRAAVQLAEDLISPGTLAKIRAASPNPVIVAVHAEEASGRNQIPKAMAEVIADRGGWAADTEIIQANRAGHTGATAMQRLTVEAAFAGAVEAGRDYVLVDDMLTSGGTVNALRSYIQGRGGRPVMVLAMAASSSPQTGHGGKMRLRPDTRELLRSKFDIPTLDGLLSQYGIASSVNALTNSQARYLANFKDVDRLRAAIIEGRQAAGASPISGNQSQPTVAPAAVEAVAQLYDVPAQQLTLLLEKGHTPYQGELSFDSPATGPASPGPDGGPATTGQVASGPDGGQVIQPRALATHAAADFQREFARNPLISSIDASKVPAAAVPTYNVNGQTIESPADFARTMLAIRSPYNESLKLAILDENNVVQHSEVLYAGALDGLYADARDFLRLFEKHAAKGRRMLIAHNHPSGVVTPSEADRAVTSRCQLAAKAAGFEIIDHVITNGDEYYSFTGQGLYPLDNAPRADWEVLPRKALQHTLVDDNQQLEKLVKQLRQGNQDFIHVIYLNTRLYVTAIERATVQTADFSKLVIRGIGREGAMRVLIDFGPNTQPHSAAEMVRKINRETGGTTQVLDFAANTVMSGRQQGYLQDSPGQFSVESDAEAITAAENELRAAIRQHMNPPAGMSKAEALTAKNAAATRLRILVGQQLEAMTGTNVAADRTPEQTAEMISQTVDMINSLFDDIADLKARSQPVPSDLAKLAKQMQTRLAILKGWSDDQTEAAAAGAKKQKDAPRGAENRIRQLTLEGATNSERFTFSKFKEAVYAGLRFLASPIPELPLTGENASKAAIFRRGFRLFTAEGARVRHEAAAKVRHVLEPLEKLRTRADNDRLKRFYQLAGALENARQAGDDARIDAVGKQIEKLEAAGVGRDPFNLFRKMVLYRDLYWRGTYLKNEQGKPITLPNGLSNEEVAAELRALTAQLDAHPDKAAISEALKRHYKLTHDLQESIKAHGEIIPEALKNPLYFPHHILDYWTGRTDKVRPSTEEDFRRYLIAPTGSGKLIQADYLKAMYIHTADVLAHNARVDLVRKYWQPYDISERLKKEHGDAWDKPWNLPPGYKLYAPYKKLPLRMDYILSREVLADKLGVLFNDGDLRARLGETGQVLKVSPEDLHAALVAGEKIKWALPTEIANALDGITKREAARQNPGLGHTLGWLPRKINNFWKKTKLFAPWNWIRYEYGNTLTDIVDKVLVADPRVATYLKQAASEVIAAGDPDKPQSEAFKAASREGVFETITASEAGELQRLREFAAFATTGENARSTVHNFLAATTKASHFREATFRYAKFLADVDRMNKGERPVYAGAYHADIEALGDTVEGNLQMLQGDELIYAKAAEISLKTFGDYNSLGVLSQWLRTYAIPFWSWQDVNFRYHANQLRNIADGLRGIKGGTEQDVALRYAAVRVVSMLAGVALVQQLWNSVGGAMLGLWDDDDDLESQLSAQDRRRSHILLGKDAKGQALVVYTPSAFADVAEWIGGPNGKRLFMEWATGKITLEQFIADYAKQLPKDTLNKLAQSTGPLGKGPYETISGKAVFPDVTDQRSIPDSDRWWRLAGTMTDDRAVNWLRSVFDKDFYSQPASEQLQQMILQVRRRDPEQWAYYEAREAAADWKEKKTGKRYEAGDYNAPEAQVLRNFRRAIYRADVAGADQFYRRLLKYGYTSARLDASIRAQAPLSDLNAAQRIEYRKTLDKRAQAELALAEKYYARFAALDGRERSLFPARAGQPFTPATNRLRELVK